MGSLGRQVFPEQQRVENDASLPHPVRADGQAEAVTTHGADHAGDVLRR